MKQLFLVFLIFITILSCSRNEDSTSLIGEEWVNTKTKVYFIDTLTVKSGTFQFDSLEVSSAGRLLAGSYTDPIFGYTETKMFAQLSNSTYSIEDEAVYDSIALILKYDNYFYNDTIPNQQFKVFRVVEDIKPEFDVYYNTSFFEVDPLPLAVQEFEARPKSDSLHVTIDMTFGNELFDKIKDNDINNSDEFLGEYKGISVASDEMNTTVLGFTKESFLRIYYSIEVDGDIEEKTIDMPFNTTHSFSQIRSDRAGTIFEAIEDEETILPSTETNDNSFMQAGTGLVTRIDIPYLDRLNDISGQGTIIDAKIKLSLKPNSSTANLFTRDSIRGYIVDRKANILAELLNLGVLENENPEFNDAYYVMEFKNFLEIKQLETNEKYYLALYPQNFNSSVNRYVFNGEEADRDERVVVELTYAVYDE